MILSIILVLIAVLLTYVVVALISFGDLIVAFLLFACIIKIFLKIFQKKD